MARWAVGQFGDVVDRLRRECPQAAWDDLMMRYSALVELGPMCGSHVAKKLKNGKDIWELIGHADNCQPRILFYFRDSQIVFVFAWIKQGKNEYHHAIEVAQKRRKLIEGKERPINVLEQTSKSPGVH